MAFVYFVVDNNLLSRVAWRVSPAIDHGTRPASPARPGRLHARNWGHSRSANQQKDRAYNRMTRSAVQAQMVSRQPRPDTPRSPCLLTCAGSSSTNRNSTTIIIIDLQTESSASHTSTFSSLMKLSTCSDYQLLIIVCYLCN